MQDVPRISSLSKEYVYSWIGGVDGTEDVEVAFVQADEPAELDWNDADWANIAPAGADARILIGPGAVELTDGTWQMWVRVTTSAEVPVMRAGEIVIT